MHGTVMDRVCEDLSSQYPNVDVYRRLLFYAYKHASADPDANYRALREYAIGLCAGEHRKLLVLSTPRGDYFDVYDNAQIARRGQSPSGRWIMLGLVPLMGGSFISFPQLSEQGQTAIDGLRLLTERGQPRYTVRDTEGGPYTREWGNTRHGGVAHIRFYT
jgi:hypothetical protein